MRRYIILDADDLKRLSDNKPIEMTIDSTRFIVCSKSYFDDYRRDYAGRLRKLKEKGEENETDL